MNYTQEQFDKLPKWAQSEINKLKNYTQSLEQRIMQETGEAETNTYLRVFLEKHPMAKGSQVEFNLNDNNGSVEVRVDRSGEFIILYADSRRGKDMVIKPRSGNMFHIRFID
jgi:hypothetical protein